MCQKYKQFQGDSVPIRDWCAQWDTVELSVSFYVEYKSTVWSLSALMSFIQTQCYQRKGAIVEQTCVYERTSWNRCPCIRMWTVDKGPLSTPVVWKLTGRLTPRFTFQLKSPFHNANVPLIYAPLIGSYHFVISFLLLWYHFYYLDSTGIQMLHYCCA